MPAPLRELCSLVEGGMMRCRQTAVCCRAASLSYDQREQALQARVQQKKQEQAAAEAATLAAWAEQQDGVYLVLHALDDPPAV